MRLSGQQNQVKQDYQKQTRSNQSFSKVRRRYVEGNQTDRTKYCAKVSGIQITHTILMTFDLRDVSCTAWLTIPFLHITVPINICIVRNMLLRKPHFFLSPKVKSPRRPCPSQQPARAWNPVQTHPARQKICCPHQGMSSQKVKKRKKNKVSKKQQIK